MAAQQIQALKSDVVQLKAALQHIGYTSQQDRIALNKSHDHMKQLEETFLQSETVRARIENQLHEEQQEHRMCQANLDHERKRHEDTEKSLECIWNAHHQLQDIMSKVNCVVDEGIQSINYNVTDLALEVAAKSQKIHDLETQIKCDEHQHRGEVNQLKENFRRESAQTSEDFTSQGERLRELESLLQREQMKSATGNLGVEQSQKRMKSELEEYPAQGQKRRRRGRGKASRGDTPNVEPQSISGLPTVKEEDLDT